MRQSKGIRTRWAAIGAACAVTLGGGTFGVVRAVQNSGARSTYVPVTPARLLDTRTDIGAPDIPDATPVLLTVTGSVATTKGTMTVVPVGASGVVVNVTAVEPTDNGFVSLRPGDAAGPPDVSTLNVTKGGTFPNGATITLPTSGASSGQVQIWFEGYGNGGRTDLLIDVVGYYTDHNHDDRYYTEAETDSALAGKANSADVYSKTQVDTALEDTSDQISNVAQSATYDLNELVQLMTTPPHSISVEYPRVSGISGPAFGIGIKPDGNPIISYADSYYDMALKVIDCAEPTCSVSVSTNTIDDPTAQLGPWTSLGINPEGNTVIAYTDLTNGDLKVAACANPECRTPATVNVLDSDGIVGASPSLVFPSSGLPFIAYQDYDNYNLKIVACNDAQCSGGDEFVRNLTTDSITSSYLAASVDFAGNPVVAYTNHYGDIYFIRCLDPTCATNAVPVLIDSASTSSYLAMALSPSGGQVMVYASANGFKVARCDSSDCSGNISIREFTTTPPTIFFDVVVGLNDLPIVTYYENNDLKIMFCDDPACTGTESRIRVVDAESDDGRYPAMALLDNGAPVVAYLQWAPGRVKFATLIG